jgi:predicted HTH transcriptional regulator
LINTAKEDQWLDFKQQPYRMDDDEGKFEALKYVTAMANAEGGYILLGVGEKNELATGFFPIDEPHKVAKSIGYSCLQYIEPRIPALKIEPYTFE